MSGQSEITSFIKQAAKESGFDDCGIAKARQLDKDSVLLKTWLQNGFHANMKFMEKHFEKRINPELLVENARSVVVVLLNYVPLKSQNPDTLQISKYAYGVDYHEVLKKKWFSFFEQIKPIKPAVSGRYFVDSAPVMERAWAREAGLGWIGKNGMLISKKHGSFVFIGELILNIELDDDAPINSYCGSCTRCIDACPTKAIISPGIVDSNKCISYHTIENKEQIPSSIIPQMNKQNFGCDIFQDV